MYAGATFNTLVLKLVRNNERQQMDQTQYVHLLHGELHEIVVCHDDHVALHSRFQFPHTAHAEMKVAGLKSLRKR